MENGQDMKKTLVNISSLTQGDVELWNVFIYFIIHHIK